MANIRSIISSFLLIMQTNNGILARIEFMVLLNSILLLILFIFDTYRRRSRSKPVKYILLVVDAASHSIVLHTIGLMQSASIRNNLFEVWGILLVALRFGSNYITVHGLEEQRLHWSMELGQAVASFTWAANLNGTRNSDFRIPLWVLWVLQPSRIGYMYYAYDRACQSYRQGRSSVFIADYMANENKQMDHEASSDINKNDSTNNSEYKPRGTNPNDDCGVDPRSDSRVSNRRGKPEDMVEQDETETTHMILTNVKKVNLRTNSRSLNEMEKVSQKTNYQEPHNCNPNAEPQWRVREANVRTNGEVPSSSGVYDQSSLEKYPNLIQGKTSRNVNEIEEVSEKTNYHEPSSCYPNTEPQSNIGEADMRTNVEVPSSSGAYDQSSLKGYSNLIQGKTPRSVNEIEEVSEKTNNQEPSSCYPNTEPQSSIGEADVRTNVEVLIRSGAYDPSSMRGYQYIIQGETWQEVEAEMLELEDKLQLTVTRKEKLITLEKIWNCKGKLMGEWGDKDDQLKDICLSYALYRLLRCRFDNFPLPDNSIPKTRTLLVDNILSRTKNRDSIKKGNKGPEELQEGTKEENESTEEQQGDTKEGNENPNGQGNDNNQHGVVWYLLKLYSIISIMKRALCFIYKKEKQQDGSNAEKNEDEVTEEVANRVFEITGTELSFLNDYMYSRFPVIFWRARGLIFSIMFYVTIVASTCWVAISVVYMYTPDEFEFTHEINGTNIDVLITWSMLLFIVVKETWEILIYLFSDWAKVMLISMYVERTCTRNWLMENFIWLLCKCSMVRKWHGKIDQYNFLEAYDYKPGVCNLAFYLSLGSLPKATHGVESKSLILLPKEVKKAIVKSISSLLKEEPKKGCLPGGMPSILSRNNVNIAATSQISELQGLHTSFVKREQELDTCSHIILVWHIATSLCEIELCRHYNIYLSDSELPSLWSSLNCCYSEPFLVKLERLGKDLSKNFIVANSLSRYCAYLLIKQPDLLADNMFIAEEIFQHAVHEARNTLEGCDTLQSIYKRLMEEGGKEIKSKKENTIMRRSARLGKILIETLDEAARWKALAGVWADLLVYMAPNSNVEAHKTSLATGGELITHVWILLYHAGILENSLTEQEEDIDNLDDIVQNCIILQGPIDQDEENDVENPDVDQGEENDAEESSLDVVIHQGEDNDTLNPHTAREEK